MVKFSKTIYEEMVAHAKADYPHECCGALIGKHDFGINGIREVLEARPLKNINTDRAHDRFLLDDKDLIELGKELRGTGRDVIGYYHSHPDHPSAPSDTDREYAQEDTSYIIIAVQAKDKGIKDAEIKLTSWVFDDFKAPFSEEEVVID